MLQGVVSDWCFRGIRGVVPSEGWRLGLIAIVILHIVNKEHDVVEGIFGSRGVVSLRLSEWWLGVGRIIVSPSGIGGSLLLSSL